MEKKLENQIKKAILNSKEYNRLLADLADKTNRECEVANSEETVAIRIESNLKEALKWYSFDFAPIREHQVKETVRDKLVSKRIDSRFRNVICEYKKLITQGTLDENTNQLIEYISSLAKQEKQYMHHYIGILTDGRSIRFCMFTKNEARTSPLLTLNHETYREFVKIYLSLDRKDLSSTHLLKDFAISGLQESVTKKLARTLYTRLENPTEKTFMLHSEWERLFQLASKNENNNKKIKERKKAMSKCLGIPLSQFDSTKGLFALQTAYIIIIKLVAYNVVSEIFFGKTNLRFKDLLKLDSQALRTRLEQIENGDIFKDIGIINLLEGDFYSWYVYKGTWNTELYDTIRECIQILSVYDTNQSIFSKTNIHDLFNDLYQSIIPKEVRSSLGEYYTPNWLAEHVVKNTDKPQNWRGLDPCVGSGTFILKLIEEIIREDHKKTQNELLYEIFDRVKAIDINPLAVLTCRINYFLAISHLFNPLNDSLNIEVPVYLGDSAFVPLISKIDGVEVVNYSLETKKGKIDFSLPTSIISKKDELNKATFLLESAVVSRDKNQALQIIYGLVDEADKKEAIQEKISEFVENLICLEEKGWNRIWVRIIIGFLKIATLGKFDIVIGNPPWIDWKYLPDGYRETLKSISKERHLFSGDTFVGGINLNICALIANVVANNWLIENGTLAFLMPRQIAFQQSYKGFRNLIQNDGINLKYQKFTDWSKSGNPFYPVTENFMTYYLKKTKQKQIPIVPTTRYKIKKGKSVKFDKQEALDVVINRFDIEEAYGFMNEREFNNFTFETDKTRIPIMKKISGSTMYEGRVGLGIYPKELLMFKVIKKLPSNRVIVENYQGKITERKIAKQQTILETKYLHPVIESPNIEKFKISKVNYVAPLPYTEKDIKRPIEPSILKKQSPKLHDYYFNNRELMKKTEYNERVQGKKGAFYSLTRVGKYTFGKYKVVYRNNTKWVAAVVSTITTPWGMERIPMLLDHACSISQDNGGRFISEDEAHYICAILNSETVKRYIENSSDSRSFKTIIPIQIKKYDSGCWVHQAFSEISKKAHQNAVDEHTLNRILNYLLKRYIEGTIDSKLPSQLDKQIEKSIIFSDEKWVEKLKELI